MTCTISGREERTASLSSRNLGMSSRMLGSRGQVELPLCDWEKISYAVDRYDYDNIREHICAL